MIDLKKYHFYIENKKAQKLTKIFLTIAFFICLTSVLLLLVHNYHYISKELYPAAIIIFRTGVITATFSVVCGIFFSNYEYLEKKY